VAKHLERIKLKKRIKNIFDLNPLMVNIDQIYSLDKEILIEDGLPKEEKEIKI
jgi:hypothetical protein